MKHTSENHFITIGSFEEGKRVPYESKKGDTKELYRFLIKTTKEDDDEQQEACFVEHTTFKASHMAKLDCLPVGSELTVKGFPESRPSSDGTKMFTSLTVTSIQFPPGFEPKPAAGKPSDGLNFKGALDKPENDDIGF